MVDSSNPADYIVLTDPGDGSLLTTRADETAYGVFEDVKWDIAAGATLVQGYTGFIYEGPMWAGTINRALVRDARRGRALAG